MLVKLTEILPVSIPRDSLLVSGLKDIQEHGAEDEKTNKNSNLKVCMYVCQPVNELWEKFTVFSTHFLSL